jgi:hypothetical protein
MQSEQEPTTAIENETFNVSKITSSFGLRMCHLKGKKFLKKLSDECHEEITYEKLITDSKRQRGRTGGTYLASKWKDPITKVLTATTKPKIMKLTSEVKPIEKTVILIKKDT